MTLIIALVSLISVIKLSCMFDREKIYPVKCSDEVFPGRGLMLTIGLTGGIGTGKSLVSEILEALGAQLVNADILGHRAYLPSTKGFDQIVKCFGKRIVGQDGLVDRKILGKLVFADVESMSAGKSRACRRGGQPGEVGPRPADQLL